MDLNQNFKSNWIPSTLNNGWEYKETINDKSINKTLLEFLACKYKHSSLEIWSQRMQKGQIKVNRQEAKNDQKLNYGDMVSWARPAWKEPGIPSSINIIFDNQDILIINKPSGLPTTPGGGFLNHTLTELLYLETLLQRKGMIPKPVHRLGRFTSGILICARQQTTRARLATLFRNNFSHSGSFRRVYRASKKNKSLKLGQPIQVNTPITKYPHPLLDEIWNAANEYSKNLHSNDNKSTKLKAFSSIKLIERRDNSDLLEVTIFTGRPHQIRIHLASLGTPLIGDPFYGPGGQVCNKTTPGQGGYFLHAHKLLNVPIGSSLQSFEAPLPHELCKLN